ncbi:MAG: hypothetical protein M0023_16620 [Desulfobacteraceae bacterium]|nr:hypothetical protein [Desulfobacteraceae bacterium]
MVNLLFISGNSKINSIKNSLQPLLKVKIDVVNDFDYGLKDVFEKRPALVFIQDQIAGVTGESVARHIQMLLGTGAPSFILMHDGNLKAKPIKGLYDQLIDLSHDDAKVMADIQNSLKSLLGSQWQKIFVSPKAKKPNTTPTLAVPGDHRIIADQLVDELFSSRDDVVPELEKKDQSPDFTELDSSQEEPFQFVSSTNEQLEDILSAVPSEAEEKENVTATVSATDNDYLPESSEPELSSPPLVPANSPHNTPEPREHDAGVPPDETSPGHAVWPENDLAASASPHKDMTEKPQPPPILPADFRIGREGSSLEMFAKEILLDSEDTYRSQPVFWKYIKVIAFLVVLCAAGYYGLKVMLNLHLPAFMVKTYNPAIVTPPSSKPATTTIVTQNRNSTQKNKIETTLPSFIPLSGLDPSFAAKKPGWERYVGVSSEFRVFRSGGKLRALQVLAAKGHVISESSLKTILNELTGTSEYQIRSQEQKHGLKIIRATVNRNTDLLIYRNKSAVQAFVVSID